MPKSKSKRNKYVPPPKPKPKPAPRWVPVLFFVLAGLGFISIMSRYFLATPYPIFDNNWWQWGGLLAIAAAFGVATQWR
ncbi:MAG TPA: cell division protein CrgA [Actinomycetota bacterium]|nr:cell division protein CrgA [Actinomycetota bacterium]